MITLFYVDNITYTTQEAFNAFLNNNLYSKLILDQLKVDFDSIPADLKDKKFSGIEIVNFINDCASVIPLASDIDDLANIIEVKADKLLNHEYNLANCATLKDAGFYHGSCAVLNINNEELVAQQNIINSNCFNEI